MTDASSGTPTEAQALAKGWLEHSPFVRHLGMELVEMGDDRATMRMPFSDALPTAGDVVHGGAITALLDTTAAVAAWSGHDVALGGSWGTVGISVTFQAAARGEDLTAVAEVTRRTKSMCFLTVSANDRSRTVASALVTYRLG